MEDAFLLEHEVRDVLDTQPAVQVFGVQLVGAGDRQHRHRRRADTEFVKRSGGALDELALHQLSERFGTKTPHRLAL